MKMNIIMIIASSGFQDVEYQATRAELLKEGAHVVTLSDQAGYAVSGRGERVKVDGNLESIATTPYDALVVVGGPGAWEKLNIPAMHKALSAAVKDNKVIAAICISPRILAVAGVLTGKHATGWDNDQQLGTIFIQHGVIYDRKPVVIDGNYITADGPSSAPAFGKAIIQRLKAR